MIETLDTNVGRILDHLRQAAVLTERTLVVFTSDNGGYIGQYRGKQVTEIQYPASFGEGLAL
jgi:arylsulfatase A-like enzyme